MSLLRDVVLHIFHTLRHTFSSHITLADILKFLLVLLTFNRYILGLGFIQTGLESSEVVRLQNLLGCAAI